MADLATVTDVEAALLRPLTASEAGYVPGLIGQVEALLRQRVPDMDSRLVAFATGEPGGVDPVVLAGVVARVVARALLNPGGVSSRTESTGPFSATDSYRDPGGRVMTGIYLTADDLAGLGIRRGGVKAKTLRVPLGSFGRRP